MACFLTAPDGFMDLLRASEENLWTYLVTVSVSDCMVSNGVRISEQRMSWVKKETVVA